MGKTKKSTKKALFAKESGARSPVLRRKASQSESDFLAEMRKEWSGLEEGQYKWSDDRLSVLAIADPPESEDKTETSATEKPPSELEVEAPKINAEVEIQANPDEKRKEESKT